MIENKSLIGPIFLLTRGIEGKERQLIFQQMKVNIVGRSKRVNVAGDIFGQASKQPTLGMKNPSAPIFFIWSTISLREMKKTVVEASIRNEAAIGFGGYTASA